MHALANRVLNGHERKAKQDCSSAQLLWQSAAAMMHALASRSSRVVMRACVQGDIQCLVDDD
eukprot:10475-Heterococcus_DN1.PRE.2